MGRLAQQFTGPWNNHRMQASLISRMPEDILDPHAAFVNVGDLIIWEGQSPFSGRPTSARETDLRLLPLEHGILRRMDPAKLPR